MRIRPHHLLCTQGFRGKGYSSEFVENMVKLTARLRQEERTIIDLVFTTDDLCDHCPNKAGEGLCTDQEKVDWFDRGVIEVLQLAEGRYCYQDLAARLRRELTPEGMDRICGRCSWYPVSACRISVTGVPAGCASPELEKKFENMQACQTD